MEETVSDSMRVYKVDFTLEDGKTVVDISTKEGTHTVLYTSSFVPFELTANKLMILRKKKKMDDGDKSRFASLNRFFLCIAANADADLFLEKIPQSEIKSWLNYVIAEFNHLARDPCWIQTGTFNRHDSFTLPACGAMFAHFVPVALAFASNSSFFSALAKFVKAGNNGALPEYHICACICCIVYNAHLQAVSKWNSELIFKQLEASGVLFEFLRCVAVLQPSPLPQLSEEFDSINRLLSQLQACPALLRRKFKRGQPCGDLLVEMLEDRSRNRNMRPEIMDAFQKIVFLADATASSEVGRESSIEICNYCTESNSSNQSQQSLMKCGRCKRVHYCSKRCQKADWPTHKLICAPVGKAEKRTELAVAQAAAKFKKDNFYTIISKMHEECEKTGLEPSDMVIEIDFMPNREGVIPVMQKPPIFNIVPQQKYLDGSRPEEMDWFHIGSYTSPEQVSDGKNWACKHIAEVVPKIMQEGEVLTMLHIGQRIHCIGESFYPFLNKDMFDVIRNVAQEGMEPMSHTTEELQNAANLAFALLWQHLASGSESGS